jgi:TonB family protein
MRLFAMFVLLAVLCGGCFGQAVKPVCGLAALRDAVMTGADAMMDGYLLFRGEVASLPRDINPPAGGCCSGPECISVQCSEPLSIPPFMVLDYSIVEGLWGDIQKPAIQATYEAGSPCGRYKPALHQKIITYCSLPEGGEGSAWCARPIVDTDANLARVRAWIPDALRRQQRVKVTEEQARSHLIHQVKPVLPKVDVAPDHLKGDVVVRIFITTSGEVRSIRAISGPSFELRQSAINAVSLWRFKPFLDKGRPVRVDTTMTIHF